MEFIATIEKIEKSIYGILMMMLVLVLIAAMIDLTMILFDVLVKTTPAQVDTHEMITVLGAFLLVLGVGCGGGDSTTPSPPALSIIAIARKVILIDPTVLTSYEYGFELMSIGVIVVGLSAGYYLIKRAGITIGPGMKKCD